MSLTALTLLTAQEYFSEITQKIANAKPGDRIALMSMIFDPTEPVIHNLMHELTAAAKRGVKVQLNVDAHSFMIDDDTELPTGPMLLKSDVSQTKHPRYRAKVVTLETLADNGGTWHITNQPTAHPSNPFAGRSHIKCTVINNESYLGGCNLGGSDSADAMVRTADKPTADWLYNFITTFVDTNRFGQGDITRKIDDATTLYVDAGSKHQSTIYKKALEIIDQAEKMVTITCQFFPGGVTARHLAAALNRGVEVTVYFNDPWQRTNALKALPLQVVQWYETSQHPRGLFLRQLGKNHPYLHAKLLANEKAAMIGSHNYVMHGVHLGTVEMTLLRQNVTFANDVANLAYKLAN